MELVLNIPVLYGERYLTSNVCLLLHLTDKVVDLGPLWASSCFYFKDFNGQLRCLFHGTQHIETQIAFAVGIHQGPPKLAKSLKHGTSEKDLYTKIMEKKTLRGPVNVLEIDSLLLVLITTEHLLQMKKKQFVIHL